MGDGNKGETDDGDEFKLKMDGGLRIEEKCLIHTPLTWMRAELADPKSTY